MKTKFILLLSLVIACLVYIKPVEAGKRLLPRFRSGKTSTYAPGSFSGVTVSPRLRGDWKALVVYFGNLQNTSSVTYSLTYSTNEKPEGVGGTIKPTGGASTSRTLLFGTCSGGICRYHSNITNMRFEVVSKLTSGKTSIKRYRVRI